MTTTAPASISQIDHDIGNLTKAYWEDQKRAAHRKSIVLVEGDDDREILETFLKRRSLTYESRIRVVPAGGRENVLKRLKNTFPSASYPNAYGLVDRDTWTDAEITTQRAAEPRLFITAGWCLENAFFHPDALRLCGALVETQVSEERERWVRAGALWWALQRTREAQQRWQEALGWSYGSPKHNLDLSSANALADGLKRAIPQDVRDDSSLDVDLVAKKFSERQEEIRSLPVDEQWQIGVHGKRAFKDLLAPACGSELRALRLELAKEMQRPPPIDELIALLLP